MLKPPKGKGEPGHETSGAHRHWRSRGARTFVSPAAKRVGFLLTLAGAFLSDTHTGFAASLIAGVGETPQSFLLTESGIPVASIEFDFQMENQPEGDFERGWLEGISSPDGPYRSGSWPVAGPDRFDRYSVRWRGTWDPGAGAREIRLRSDGDATLFIAGQEGLVCHGSVSGATAHVEFEDRPYDLRLDYSHATGDSFVFLEYRHDREVWMPLVPFVAHGNERREGWEGSYHLGSRFETEAFRREDPKVIWNWGELGPFHREEDLPSVELIWCDRDDALMASLVANRKGSLFLKISSPPGSGTPEVRFEKTSLSLTTETGEDLAFQFDQPGEETADGVRFELDPRRAIRFWETGKTVRDGGQVGERLERNRESYSTTRPRLEGAIAPFDDAVCRSGRWWVEMMLNRIACPISIRDEEVSSLPIEVREEIVALMTQWAEVYAPDVKRDLWEGIGSGVASAFPDASREEVERLISATKEERGHSREAPNPYPERQVAWRIQSFTEGFTEWVRAFRELQDLLHGDGEGGVDFTEEASRGGEIRIENLPIEDRRFSFEYSPTRFRVENDAGCFIEFKGTVSVRDFQLNEKGEWEATIEGSRQTLLETGPNSMVSGATWDGDPILMTGQDGGRKRGFLPGNRGVLRLIPAPAGDGVPRF